MIRKLTIKEVMLSSLILFYIGGASYFWGSVTDDAYLIIVTGFLLSHFVGNPVIRHLILRSSCGPKIRSRVVRILMDFLANILIANLLIFIIRLWHPGDLAEYLAGPMVYGVMYCTMYFIYMVTVVLTPLNSCESS